MYDRTHYLKGLRCICLYLYLSLYLSVYLSIYLSTYLSIYLSIKMLITVKMLILKRWFLFHINVLYCKNESKVVINQNDRVSDKISAFWHRNKHLLIKLENGLFLCNSHLTQLQLYADITKYSRHSNVFFILFIAFFFFILLW